MTPFEWIYLAVMIVGMAYTYTNMPKTPVPTALTLEDAKIPSVELGREIGVVFGTRDINDAQVVWYGDLRTSPIKVSSGK